MQTERGQFAFAVKELANGTPYIVAEPLTRAPQISVFDQGRLQFDVPAGTTVEQAQEIADYLSRFITHIGFTRVSDPRQTD